MSVTQRHLPESAEQRGDRVGSTAVPAVTGCARIQEGRASISPALLDAMTAGTGGSSATAREGP
jgi:hypothetical protein